MILEKKGREGGSTRSLARMMHLSGGGYEGKGRGFKVPDNRVVAKSRM